MPLSALAISKRFQQNWALKDVTIEVPPGGVFGICGPSGAGKSTFLRILAGFERDFSGQFTIDGSPHLSTSEAVLIGSRPLVTTSWFSRLWRPDLHVNGSSDLSHLERARFSDKRIVLLDDAFCGKSQSETAESFKLIRELAASTQKYFIFAASDFRDVLEYCDECVLIDHGSVIQAGTPEEVYSDPVSAAAAAITGRINLIESRRISSSKAEIPQFQTIAGSHKLSIAKAGLSHLGAINQNVLLSIRPEHISISFGASFPEDNLLKAVIVDWKFLGPSTLVSLDCKGLKIEALVMRLVGLKPGDECMIGMPPDRISILLK